MAKTVLEIDVNTGNSVKSLTDLKKEFKEIQKELSGLTPDTKEYVNALERLGEVKDQIGDLRSEIEGFAGTEKKIGAVVNVMGNLASGFQAATAASQLFGSENKAIAESMAKLQQVMALTQGIQGLAGITDNLKVVVNVLKSTTIGTKLVTAAQWLYNAAMAANPIGLIIAGLTALVGVIALVVNSMEDENEAQKQVIAARERELEVMDSQMTKFKEESEFRKQLAAAMGKSAEDQLKLNKYYNDQENILLEQKIQKLKKNISERTAILNSASNDELEETKKKNEEDNKQIAEARKRQREIENQNKLEQAKFDEDQRKKAEEKKKADDEKAKERAKKKAADDLEAAEKWRQEQAKFIQYEIDALNNKYGEEEQIIAEQQLATKIALGHATPEEIEAWNAYRLKQEAKFIQYEIDALNNKYGEEEQIIAEQQLATKIALGHATPEEIEAWNAYRLKQETDYLKELSEIQNKRREENNARIEKEYEDERKRRENELAIKKRNAEFEVKATQESLTAISQLTDAFAGKSVEDQKKAFNIKKAVSIAQATIDTYLSAQTAYASQIVPLDPTSPIRGAIAAGIAVASGLARVAVISKQQFNAPSTGGSTGGGNLGSFSQGGASQPPGGLTAQNNVTQLNPDGTVAGQGNREMQPMKAYVVESESRAVTERVNKLSNQSKI